jgi:Domain of unknown function (DUF4407)
MDTERTRAEPLLWWIAGADARVLAECPRADQIFVQHLGISLIGAFVFVFTISAVSILVAFPGLAGSTVATAFALVSGLLIAMMVFLIDRLFIQSDWDWQAAQQRNALTRAGWEFASIEEKLVTNGRALTLTFRARRFAVISFRVLLSAAIGLTIASFLELVLYKEELKPLMQRLHYEDNKEIYDEISTRTKRLDEEIAAAKGARDRLVAHQNELDAELSKLELQPPLFPAVASMQSIEDKISDLRSKIAEDEDNIRRQSQTMIGEFRGTVVSPGNSGVAGAGQRYWTAVDLKALSESNIALYRSRIGDLEQDRERLLKNWRAEHEATRDQAEQRKSSLRERLRSVADNLAAAEVRLTELEESRDGAIQTFAASLKSRPNFVPLSFGVASQFRALRMLYREYGSSFEMIMIKLLIMTLEMTPVLQKVFLSPATLYAVKLDAAKRAASYSHFDEEVRLRQEHLKRKADAADAEDIATSSIRAFRRAHVPFHHKVEEVD